MNVLPDPGHFSKELDALSVVLRKLRYHSIQLAFRGPAYFQTPDMPASMWRRFGAWLGELPRSVQVPQRLFCLNETILLEVVAEALSTEVTDALLELGLVNVDDPWVSSDYSIIGAGDLTLVVTSLHRALEEPVYIGDESYGFMRHALDAAGCVMDLGCGSGILGLAAAQRPAVARLWLVDINPEAVWVARVNTHLNGVAHKTECLVGDLFVGFQDERFDLVISNPPFLALPPELAFPATIDGGPFGVSLIERILATLPPGAERLLMYFNSPGSAGKPMAAATMEAFSRHQPDRTAFVHVMGRRRIEEDSFAAYAEVAERLLQRRGDRTRDRSQLEAVFTRHFAQHGLTHEYALAVDVQRLGPGAPRLLLS